MKRYISLCAITLIVSLATACNQTVDRDAEAKAIQADEAQWVQDFASKDVEKIVSHYADDATFIVPGMPPISGKDAIRNFDKQMVSDPTLSLKFQSSKVEVANSGDLAYTQGSYTMSMTDPQTHQPINDSGSYVTTWRRRPGASWKAVSDIITSNMPPPASQQTMQPTN
jgi:uncharacterized protein (TIGR02246 family)